MALSVTVLQSADVVVATPVSANGVAAADVTQAVDIASARAAARTSGQRVEALSERTETSTTWVNEDGSLTTEVAAGPVRFYDQDARTWRSVDVNLTRDADGAVESKAHPQGLRLAGRSTGDAVRRASLTGSRAARANSAGASDLVTLGEGDGQITLQWKGALPAPTLKGNRAEYENALPGADVVVEATRTGFEQFVELKQRPAGDSSSYTLPLKARGLTVAQRPDGSVLLTDRRSEKTAVMPAPVMWDATVDAVSGEHTRTVPAALKVVHDGSSVSLVVTPDAAFLADPKTKYPVTVDPSTSALSNVMDTYVQQGETGDLSTDTELDLGNPGTKNSDGTARTARSFITWNTAPIANALVSSARLSLWNFHSGNTDCKAAPWEVWSAGAASTGTRWTSQPAWNSRTSTSTQTRGNSACTSASDGWIDADATSLVQSWASANATRGTMGLRAADENVVAQWKRVNSANAAANPPRLTVNYNYRPRTGTKQQAGPPFTQDKTGTWRVDTTTPTLRDTFSDPDGDQVDGAFQIFDAATNTQVGDVLMSKFTASGTPAEVAVPDGVLRHGRTYRFRTSPYDGTHYTTEWSAWATFSVAALPDTPQDLQSGAEQTLTPIISAVVTDPAQGRVSAEFAVKDSAGSAVPGLNVSPVWTDSGRRAALRLPERVLTDGAAYRWTVRACTSVGCSPWSAQQTMNVREKPLPAAPDSKTLTLADDTLDQVSTATDCTTTPCPTASDGELLIGPAGGHQWATRFTADLSGLPKGARITSATLSLTRSNCAADCTAQQPGVYELSSAWTSSESGGALLDAAGTDDYASGTPLPDLDLGPLVQSWTERGENQGFALTVPADAHGAAYHSLTAADTTTRPRLTIRYLPPTTPSTVTDVVTVPGDSGLLATWNPPLDPGAAGELRYTAQVEKTDGAVVAEQETTTPRVVFTKLDNTVPYRVSVRAKNTVGDGPLSRSAPAQGAAVPDGTSLYRDVVQEYLAARGKILTSGSLSAADAAADAPHGTVFSALLGAQEPNLVDSRQALADNGQSYAGASAQMTDVLVSKGATADQVVVRANVTESMTLHGDGGDEPTTGSALKRYTFDLTGGTAVMDGEADDFDAGQTLSPTAAAQSQVETTSATDSQAPDDTSDDPGSIELGENGFPDETPPTPTPDAKTTAKTLSARSVSGHGTANWAYNHTDIGWEYSQDCTNFVSKALYHGGGMKFRWGGRKTDGAWWQQYYLFGSIKNKSYTWSGADNLRRHFSGHRPSSRVTKTYNAQLGDIVFFKWKKEPRYNHAAVVTSKVQGHLGLSQHGIKNHTTLDDVLARYRGTSNPIQRVLIIRPRSAK